jgi:enoyl-CoA hydratase/carnithine racemase
MAEKSTVLLDKRGVALWIALNRPEKRNAINRDVIDGIREGYQQAHADRAVHLDQKTQWLVNRVTDKSPTAIRREKCAMRAMASMSFDEGIAYTESQIALLALTNAAARRPAACIRTGTRFQTGRVWATRWPSATPTAASSSPSPREPADACSRQPLPFQKIWRAL